MDSIAVFGGAGYIGSHIVQELCKSKFVTVVDNLTTGNRDMLPSQVTFFEGDVRDKKFLASFFQKIRPQAVIHVCDRSNVQESVTDPLLYYENNVVGMVTLLQEMRLCGCSQLVYSSSAAAYGDIDSNEINMLPVNSPLRPKNPYGECKATVERLLHTCGTAYGLNFVAFRFFNVAGAHESGLLGEIHSPQTHLIPVLLEVAAGVRDSASLYGTDYPTRDGTCVRDFVHVCDVAHAHLDALCYLRNGGLSTCINLGSGMGYTVREVIKIVQSITGCSIRVDEKNRRPGDPTRLVACVKDAKKILRWSPRHSSLPEIVASAWKFYSSYRKH